MCRHWNERPTFVPLLISRREDHQLDLVGTVLLGKALEIRRGGHRGMLGRSYKLHGWDEWVPGTLPGDVLNVHLQPEFYPTPGVSEEWSPTCHHAFYLPSTHLLSDGCYHDRLFYGLGCLTCDRVAPQDVFYRDYWRDLKIVKPGAAWLPLGRRVLSDDIADRLKLVHYVLPADGRPDTEIDKLRDRVLAVQ